VSAPVLTRRGLVGSAAAAGAVFVVPRATLATGRRGGPIARAGTFPSGVAAGLPTTRGITLWTRLGELERSQRVWLEVARDPQFRRVIERRRVLADASRDFTARTRITGRALRPGEQYWYRFATRTTDGPVGRFRTARPADSREPVRIGFFSCQRWEHGYFTPQLGLAAEDDLDVVVSLGDYLYDQDTRARVRSDGTGSPNGHAETLAQWRAKHRLYRTDAALQAMHAAHPFVAIWDDCEVEGNWAGDEESASPGPERDPRQVPFATKRANAFRTFFENMPLERFPRAPTRIHRSLRLGRHAELFLLDSRQYRDPQPCAGGTPGQPCPDAELVERARLGAAQTDWLLDGLSRSGATWKLLGNAQMTMALDLPAGVPLETDSWNGYGVERRRLLEGVRARGVRNLTSIVGDVHVFLAGNLTTTGRAGGVPVGTEFVGASVSHDALDLSELSDEQEALLTERIVQANPHLVYGNLRRRGYGVLEARGDELVVEFKAVRSVAERRSPAALLKRFRVHSGVPLVQGEGLPIDPPAAPSPAPALPPLPSLVPHA